jgi:hypothetical protein
MINTNTKNSNLVSIGALYEFFDVKSLTDIDSLKKMYFKTIYRWQINHT